LIKDIACWITNDINIIAKISVLLVTVLKKFESSIFSLDFFQTSAVYSMLSMFL